MEPPFKAREPNYILVGTALTFMIPYAVGYFRGYYIAALACLLILISSVAFHQNPTHLTYWTDQVMISLFILMGGILAFQKSTWLLLAILGFLVYAVLIFYGPLESVCAYHPEPVVASLWHGSLHIIPAIGITLLYA